MRDLQAAVGERQRDLLGRRRHFHSEPELSFAEVRTAQVIAEHLSRWGYQVQTEVARTGVVATLRGGRAGAGVLVRADMDGLPLQERGDLPFASRHAGVMHACGHDVHMAIALTLAELLASRREGLPGTVRFAFQPAEELVSGAKPMVEAGVLDGMDAVVGLHVWTGLPVGTVAVRPGVLWASSDQLTITIRGRGGHGAQPHLTVDAVVAAAQLVTALQTLVSRETSPTASAVITIGSIHGGTAANIVAEEVALQGTLRTLDAPLRDRLLARISELSQHIAVGMGAQARVERIAGAPPVVNDAAVAAIVAGAARDVVGSDGVTPYEVMMVAEDISYFLEQRPGCFFLLGGAPEGEAVVHHTSTFAIDERCLPIGLEVLAGAVLRLLEARPAQARPARKRQQAQAEEQGPQHAQQVQR